MLTESTKEQRCRGDNVTEEKVKGQTRACVCMCVPADQSPEEEEEGRPSVSNHPETEEKRGLFWVIIKGRRGRRFSHMRIQHSQRFLLSVPLAGVTLAGGAVLAS